MTKYLALFLILLAGPVLSLSCRAPSLEREFGRHAAAAEEYTVVAGKFYFARHLGGHNVGDPVPEPFLARFIGKALDRDGFTSPYQKTVTVTLGCAGPWCGNLIPKEDAIYYLNVGGDMPALEIGACTFPHPNTAQNRAVVLACLNDPFQCKFQE